jgi:hypothetical protein
VRRGFNAPAGSIRLFSTSERDFLPDAIEELKGLCIVRFAEAAEQNGMACLYAGMEGWRNLSYTEGTNIESV